MKWMWLAMMVCVWTLVAIEEIRIADLEMRCAEAEAWDDAVEAEAQEWLEKAWSWRE